MKWLAGMAVAVTLVAALLWADRPIPEEAFADVFAAVLTGENPDGGEWNPRGAYLDAARGRAALSPSVIRAVMKSRIGDYRVLVVPGFMSAIFCIGIRMRHRPSWCGRKSPSWRGSGCPVRPRRAGSFSDPPR